MKIALNLIKILIFIFALIILTQNSSQYVDIKFFTMAFAGVNLLAVILVSLTVGAVMGVVFMAFSMIQSRGELKKMRNKNKQLTTELENLRNISIEEIPDENVPPVPAPAPSSDS